MHLDLVSGYQKIITIILLILAGFVAKKRGIIVSETQSAITNLLIRLVIPFSVFAAFISPFDWGKAKQSFMLIGISLVFYPAMQLLITRIFFSKVPRDEERKRLFRFDLTYSNAVFMGYPFAQALFGANGLFFASVYNLPYNVYLWSIGYADFTKQPMSKEGIKNTLTNPVIIACVLGYAWWLLQNFVPASSGPYLKPVWDVFTTVSGANTPLSMILIGAMVADSKVGQVLADKEVWFFTVCKLLVIPGLMFTILYFLDFRGWILAIPTVIAAMPTCATGGILAARFDIQKELAASIITFTTLLSAFTIPLWLVLILKGMA